MKENWTYKKLGEVAESDLGKTLNQSKDKGELYSYLCAINIQWDKIDMSNLKQTRFENNELERYSVVKGDLLVCEGGDVGRAAIWNEDYPIQYQNALHRVRFNGEVFNRFCLYYLFFLKQIGAIDTKYAKGVTIKHLVKSSLLSIPIPIPPMEEQERIVAELDLLQSVIDKKKAQLDEYDKLAQSIFYEMFGECKNNVEVSKYIKSLGGGKSLAGQEECINKVLKTGAVTYDFFNEKEVKNLPVDYIPNPEHLLHDGDILISRMNTLEYVGACAYVWKAPDNTYLPDRLWRAVLGDNANPIFIWFSLIQDNVKEQIRGLASGTSGSMKNISMPRFLSVKIKEVPLSLQQSFAEKIEAIEHQKELVKQSLNEVKTLFDSRMDYYFN